MDLVVSIDYLHFALESLANDLNNLVHSKYLDQFEVEKIVKRDSSQKYRKPLKKESYTEILLANNSIKRFCEIINIVILDEIHNPEQKMILKNLTTKK